MATVIKEAVVGGQFMARLGATRLSDFVSAVISFGRTRYGSLIAQIARDDLVQQTDRQTDESTGDCITSVANVVSNE